MTIVQVSTVLRRIGRIAFRAAQKRSDNYLLQSPDLLDAEYMAYMLKYDSTSRPFRRY